MLLGEGREIDRSINYITLHWMGGWVGISRFIILFRMCGKRIDRVRRGE